MPELSTSALLLIFAFGGYEVIPVPAGESHDPQRTVPFALIMTIAVVTAVMTLAQVVALGTLPGLAASKTPLADASVLFMGATGAALMTLGAVLSTLGNNMGQALSGSRSLFALAENGDVPAVFAKVSPRFGTPVVAILFTAAVSLVLASSGLVRRHGGRQRRQPPRGLCRDLRRGAAAAQPAVRRAGGGGQDDGPVRPGDSVRRRS